MRPTSVTSRPAPGPVPDHPPGVGGNVLVQYSDHVGNLVLLVDDEDVPACRDVVARWGRRVTPRDGSAVAR